RVYKTTFWHTGNFVSPKASEATPCSALPYLLGFRNNEFCNLTEINGFQWYCGRPVKTDVLNCSHFISVTRMDRDTIPPLTELEEWLLVTVRSLRPFFIANNISIEVVPVPTLNKTVLPLPELKCNKRKLSSTFEDTNTSGFFYKGDWRPLACQVPEVNTETVVRCLKDTQVILVGDSNSRRQYELLTSLAPCQDKIERTAKIWHAPLRCENETTNMSISYFPHSFPFLGSTGRSLNNTDLRAETTVLDSIPSHGKYIVHFHHFLHLVAYHLSYLEYRLGRLREAIERLLARNPHVVVLYQSAHSVYNRQSMNGVFFQQLQRRVLRGLGERVMFVYTWPMTMAADNDNVHPQIAPKFTTYYLGHICGRH
ncbi:NXPE family member 3, partial [Biomphalaria glabrata]